MRTENISSKEYWENLCVQIISIDGICFVELDEVINELQENAIELSSRIIADDKTRLLPYTSTIGNNDIADTGFTYFVPITIISNYLI